MLRVEGENEGTIWVCPTAQCRIARWTSDNSGRRQSQGAPGTWHLAPQADERAVFAPDGRRETPCVPTGLSTLGVDVVRLLCRSGRVLGTTDSGQTWLTLGRLDGAVSVRCTSPAEGVALPEPGVRLRSDGDLRQRSGLVPPGVSRGNTPQVIGADGDFVAAQVGPELAVSRAVAPAGRGSHRVSAYDAQVEAFFVVVVAVAILGVGVLALLTLRRLNRTYDPDQEH